METNCPNVLGSRELSKVWAAWRVNKHSGDECGLRNPEIASQQVGQETGSCRAKRGFLAVILIHLIYKYNYVFIKRLFEVSGVWSSHFSHKRIIFRRHYFMLLHFPTKEKAKFMIQTLPGLWWASEPCSCGRSWRCQEAGSRPLRPPAQEPPPPPGWWSSPAYTEMEKTNKTKTSA